jgi:hypothetical protein
MGATIQYLLLKRIPLLLLGIIYHLYGVVERLIEM